MNEHAEKTKPSTRLPAFWQGVAGVVLIYAALFGYAATQGGAIKTEIEDRLVSKTVLLERPPPTLQDIETNQTSLTPGYKNLQKKKAPEEKAELPVIREGLPPAPIPGLYEETSRGLLPQTRGDGMTPFKAYRRPYDFKKASTPLVGLLISGYGISSQLSAEALEALPPEISVMVSPYATNIGEAATLARNDGHETWLEIPIENKSSDTTDSGPATLMSRNSQENNQDTLNRLMSLFPGYTGIAGFMDDSFSNYAMIKMETIMGGALKRGIGFIDLNPDAPPLMSRLALNEEAPYGLNSINIPDSRIEESFDTLEKQARKNGFAFGVIKMNAFTIPQIQEWVNTLPSKDLALAPVSAIVEAPTKLMGRKPVTQESDVEETQPAVDTPADEMMPDPGQETAPTVEDGEASPAQTEPAETVPDDEAGH